VRKGKVNISRDSGSLLTSPTLKPKQSTGDLMFQMDEETTLSPGESMKGKAAMRGRKFEGTPEHRSYPDSPALGASIPEAESLEDRGFLDEQMSSPRDILLNQSPTESRAIAMHQKRGMASPPDSSAPWASPVISNNKKDLKDIMGETSQSRVSNLTLGMEGRRESSGNFKVSQKERKKMQQQQMQEKLAAEEKAKEAAKNPWQLPPPATPSKPGKDPLPGQSRLSSPEPAKAAQRPSMTMRQTVAGTPPPKPMATPVQSQSRSASANMQSSSFSKPSPSGPPTSSQQALPKASPGPAIQSVRHIPRPEPYPSGFHSPSSGSLSLATILQQQQIEKDVIREAATAKHNLQEIQAEQEFQAWWDQESRRVQGLLDPKPEQQRNGKTGRGGKASGGATPRKRRGNKNTADGGSSQAPKQTVPATAPAPAPTTPKKSANAPAQPRNAAGNQTPNGGASNGARRGHGNRGKGKDKA
jgi:hypothetical protein